MALTESSRFSSMLPYFDEHAVLHSVADTSLEELLAMDFLATEELPGIKEPSEEMMPETQNQTSDSGRKKCSSCHAKKSLTEFSGKATCDRCLAKKRRPSVVTDSSIQLEVENDCLQEDTSNTRHFKLQEQAETAPPKCFTFIATVPVHTGSDAQVAVDNTECALSAQVAVISRECAPSAQVAAYGTECAKSVQIELVAAYGTSSAPSVQAAAYSTVGDPREGWQLCSQAQLKGQTALLNAPLAPLIDQRSNSNKGMSGEQKCSSCHATKPLIEFSGKATCGRCRIKKRNRRQQHKAELKIQRRSTSPNGQTQNSNGTVQVTESSTLTSKVQS